jgi:pimeloyl-ACP methyl ester carboxylesterase
MPATLLTIVLGVMAAITVVTSGDAAREQAPPCQADGQKGRALLTDAMRYAGIEVSSDAMLDRIAAAWCDAQAPNRTIAERTAAFVALFTALAEARSGQLPSSASLQSLGQFAATMTDGGAKMDLTLPSPRVGVMKATLQVERRGRGRDTLFLIAGLGSEATSSYASFIKRHEATHKLVLVTLPGSGNVPALPWPARYDNAARPWLTAIERALLDLLDKEPQPVVLIGPSSGGYFAARLALERPARVRAAVLLDALVASPMRSLTDPDVPAAYAERLTRVRARSPAPQFFPLGTVPPAPEVRHLLDNPVPNHPSVRNWMAFAVRDATLSKQWTYDALTTGYFSIGVQFGAEMQATDLSADMQKLSVPMLQIAARHDDGSPSQGTPTTAQWRELQLRWPSIPLQVVTFENTRSFITEDRPVEFDRALDDFLNGRTVQDVSGHVDTPRPSPHALVSQAIGAARVSISYGRPAIKGRSVWGQLVPYGRVWRAGADEATEITLSHDLEVEGRRLAAGTYTFFVVPTETTWTLVFNRVAPQWGAFNYNKEFDALRVEVPAREAPASERLTYTIEPVGDGSAAITLQWGNRAASAILRNPLMISDW